MLRDSCVPGVASGILFSVRNRVWGLLASVHLKAILQGYYIIFIPIFQLGMSKLLLLRVTRGTVTCVLAGVGACNFTIKGKASCTLNLLVLGCIL